MGVPMAIMGILSLAGSVYSASEQRKATTKTSDTQQQAALDARKIAAEQKPLEESATLVTDTGIGTNALGSLGLLVDPNKRTSVSSLGTSGGAGLNITGSTAGLGFGK